MNNDIIPETSGAPIHTSNNRTPKRLPWGVLSVSLQYCFYNSYYRNFPNGPAGIAAKSAGSDMDALNIYLMVMFVLGITCCFNSVWMQLVYRHRGLKLALCLCTFGAPFAVPLVRVVWLVFVLVILGAFCAGAVMGRSLYTTVFLTIDTHPALIVVMVYIFFQTYIHAFELVPFMHTLPVYYAVGMPTLLTGLILFYPVDGDEMERRRVLPENSIRMADIWPPLAIFVLAQTSFALYEITLLPQMPSQPLDSVLKIIPNAVILAALYIFGVKLNLRGVLIVVAVMFAGAALVFAADGNRATAQMFTEPAFRFYDLFYYWLLQVCFRAYGRRLARLKLLIIINLALGVGVIVLTQLILSRLPAGAMNAFMLLPLAFGIALLIPRVERAIQNMDEQHKYAESREERDVHLPDQREDVLAARDALTETLPAGVTLTGDEQTALAYIIDGQDVDVTAYFMGITVRGAKTLGDTVVAKFKCKNVTELISRMGAAMIQAQYEKNYLTEHERDIALLLIEGETQRDISRKLSLNAAEVSQRVEGIREKVIGMDKLDKTISAVVKEYMLTKRETDILRCLQRSMTNAEIASELFLTEGTVKIHVRNLMKKLPVSDRHDVAAWVDTVGEKTE